MGAKNFVEMAMDPGQGGHLINREKRAKIDNKTHPLAKNPAFPGGDYGDKVATQAYGSVLRGLSRTGQDPAQLRPHDAMGDLMATLGQVQNMEADYRPELEELALQIVLDLPEFKDVRKAYVNGTIRFNIQLTPEMPEHMHAQNMQRVDPSEEGGEELGIDVPEIGAEIDQEVHKREFINLLIQGAAATKMHAYHLASEQLNQINPELLATYSRLVALGELSYWMKPEAIQGGGHGGESSIEQDEAGEGEDGVYVVNATAINFPLLVHELVKGIYEVVAHNVVEDPETRQHVYNRADTLGAEEWHIMKGPAVWMHLNHAINKLDAAECLPRVLNHICSLAPGTFSELVRGLLTEQPKSMNYLRELVGAIKAQMAQEDEEEAA